MVQTLAAWTEQPLSAAQQAAQRSVGLDMTVDCKVEPRGPVGRAASRRLSPAVGGRPTMIIMSYSAC